VTTTKAASAKSNAEVVIQIDPDGTQAGIFNAAGDPNLSYVRSWTERNGKYERDLDHWLLNYPTTNGPKSFHTGVVDTTAVDEAITKAQEYLREVGFEPQAAKLEQFGNEPEPNGW
jgi:hypothetical protein